MQSYILVTIYQNEIFSAGMIENLLLYAWGFFKIHVLFQKQVIISDWLFWILKPILSLAKKYIIEAI